MHGAVEHYGWGFERQPEAYRTSRRQRRKVEMLFAHLKRILCLGRQRLRGPCGAKDEFLFAAIAQDLRKLAKLIPRPRPIPATRAWAESNAALSPPADRPIQMRPPKLGPSSRESVLNGHWRGNRHCHLFLWEAVIPKKVLGSIGKNGRHSPCVEEHNAF